MILALFLESTLFRGIRRKEFLVNVGARDGQTENDSRALENLCYRFSRRARKVMRRHSRWLKYLLV